MRTGISSLNFFQAVFHISSDRNFTLQLIRSDLDFTLWSAVNRAAFPMQRAHL